jgi:cytochrome c oxidase subunit 2
VRKRPLVQMLALGVVGCAILIPIALSIHWFPADASQQAGRIHTLYKVLLIVSVLYSVWNFRMKPGEEDKDGPPIHGNTRLEIIWTAAPAVLIVGLCVYAFTVLHSNEQSKPGEMTVNVTERQFAFEFSYRNAQGQLVVSPELVLANHEPVVFHIRSLDVIHSFFVPEFSEKLDAVPGITTLVRVTPTHTGSWAVECTELCGAGHSLMRAAVKVLSPSAFQAWLASQKPNAPPPVGLPPPNAAQPGVPGSPPGSKISAGGAAG